MANGTPDRWGSGRDDNTGIMRNCQIYNNTFYNSNPGGSCIWLYSNYPGYHFHNNAFIYRGSLIYKGNKLKDEVFQGNLYWNLEGNKTFGIYTNLNAWARATGKEMMNNELTGTFKDPGFISPGNLGLTDPENINPENLISYVPGEGSPVINAGLNLRELFGLDPGSSDITGFKIPAGGKYDIGAIEFR